MAERQQKILILGGTREAAELAARLVAEGHDVTTALAGRTAEPKPLAGKLRSGGFSSAGHSGAEGLAHYLAIHQFTRLIDATHPFAQRISANAERAAQITGIAFERHQRDPWRKQPGDRWIEVSSLEEARDALPAGARALLALGSQHIALFGARTDVYYLVRMVDPPARPLPLEHHDIVLGIPPGDAASEIALMETHAISHLVCRNSGGSGAYAKIEAARRRALPVIMIGRDGSENGQTKDG
ncbi:MAG: cobalt-precorrin-6A reductase [Nitratireductor sp.]|nr:cobalt-precorrin-6A reductase [Nitratireductor sp.]